ncbi:hypothetical protein E7Z54_09885 [Nocardioides sp.]|nr:hypothetical protein E7Z54_09885 [Nocardioides sp.]
MAACGGDRDGTAEDVATSFYAAIAGADGAAACHLLAPATRDELQQTTGKTCAEAILEEEVPEVTQPIDVQVYGTAGQVRFGTDTAFLAKFRDGWRVSAVGCTPSAGDRPYDCTVAGG